MIATGVVLLAALAQQGCSSAPAPTSYGVTEASTQLDFGVKMAQRGLWDEALFRFEQAQRIDSSSATGYNNIAVAQEALGLYDEALESYQKGLRIEPSNSELKKNYARFVEFYQNFKPKEEPSADDPAPAQASDETKGSGAERAELEDPTAAAEESVREASESAENDGDDSSR